nr:hypothetical protein [Pontibacter pamirensis]
MVRVGGLQPVFLPHDALYPVLLHQAVHTRTRSADALFLEFGSNPGTAVAALTLFIDLFNLLHKLLLFPFPQADRVLQPVVVATDTNLEYSIFSTGN